MPPFVLFLSIQTTKHENFGIDALTSKGFCNWKNATKSFVERVGKVDSLHNKARKHCEDFINQRQSIVHAMADGSKKHE
jgi:phosphate-selective porin